MSENVVLLRGGGDMGRNEKQAFLDTVAMSYDDYSTDYGEAPEAIAYVLGGVKQTALGGWHITGETSDGVTSFLALSHAVLLKEAIGYEGDD